MAGSSKRFVYIPSVRNDTWLLWSKRAKTVILRAYTEDHVAIVTKLGLQQAESLVTQAGSRIESKAAYNTIQYSKVKFWFQLSNSLNIRDGLVPADVKDKLQAVFKLQCLQPLVDGETKQLEAIFLAWASSFSKIKDKETKLNDYDHKDATNLFKTDWGKSWQSHLLENSRRNGDVGFILTGDSQTDFSFAAMELTLAISEKDNPFFPKTQSRIAPDGLGVRLTVF